MQAEMRERMTTGTTNGRADGETPGAHFRVTGKATITGDLDSLVSSLRIRALAHRESQERGRPSVMLANDFVRELRKAGAGRPRIVPRLVPAPTGGRRALSLADTKEIPVMRRLATLGARRWRFLLRWLRVGSMQVRGLLQRLVPRSSR